MDIDKLRELEAKATPGPWKDDSQECLKIRAPQGHAICTMCWLTDRGRIDNDEWLTNAALIVAMRNALPELIAEIKKLRNVAEAEFADLESERDAALVRAERAERHLEKVMDQRTKEGLARSRAYTLFEEAEQAATNWKIRVEEAEKNIKRLQEVNYRLQRSCDICPDLAEARIEVKILAEKIEDIFSKMTRNRYPETIFCKACNICSEYDYNGHESTCLMTILDWAHMKAVQYEREVKE